MKRNLSLGGWSFLNMSGFRRCSLVSHGPPNRLEKRPADKMLRASLCGLSLDSRDGPCFAWVRASFASRSRSWRGPRPLREGANNKAGARKRAAPDDGGTSPTACQAGQRRDCEAERARLSVRAPDRVATQPARQDCRAEVTPRRPCAPKTPGPRPGAARRHSGSE